MLIISDQQYQSLGIADLHSFAIRMMESICRNLESKETFDMDKLEELISYVFNQYAIVSEQGVEDYLLLHYHFPVMQRDKLPTVVNDILQSKTLKEEQKLEQLYSLLITQ